MKNQLLLDHDISEISNILIKHTLFTYKGRSYEAIRNRLINKDKISITVFGGYLTLTQDEARSIIITGFNKADAFNHLSNLEDHEKIESNIKSPRTFVNAKSLNTLDQPKKKSRNGYSKMEKFLILTKDHKMSWDDLAKKLGRSSGLCLYQHHRNIKDTTNVKDLARELNITYDDPRQSILKILKEPEFDVSKNDIKHRVTNMVNDSDLDDQILDVNSVNYSVKNKILAKISYHKEQLAKLESMMNLMNELHELEVELLN